MIRNFDAWMLRTVRRLGRNPRYRALEEVLCKWFLVSFAAILITHLLLAGLRWWLS
jgi:hypothetical protein